MKSGHAILLNRSLRRGLVLASVLLAGKHELLLATRRHIAMFLVLVHRVVETTEETTLDRRLVHDDGILLILAAVATNGYDSIVTERQIVHTENVHHTGFHKRTRRMAEKLGVLVHTLGEVQCEDTHGLLAHRGLVGISGRLIVIRERDRRGHVTENHVRVNLAMSLIRRAEILGLKSNQKRFRFCRINLFNARTKPFGPVADIRRRCGNLPVHETEHGTHQTTRVGFNGDRGVKRGPRNAGVGVNCERVLGRTKHRRKLVGFLCLRHKDTIEIDGCTFLDTSFLHPRQRLCLQKVKHHKRRRVLGDTGDQREILDNAHGMAFGSFNRTDKSPRRAVKLARSQKLARLFHGSLNATKMADRRVLRQTTENL